MRKPNYTTSHKYAVICHGYGSIPQDMGGFASRFYDMGYNILTPAARCHELSQARYASMGWLVPATVSPPAASTSRTASTMRMICPARRFLTDSSMP